MNKDINIIEVELKDLTDSHKDLWTSFQDKTILLTGATGFIGTYLVKLMMTIRHRLGIQLSLVLVVRDADRARKRLGNYFDAETIHFLEQDVTAPLKYEGDIDYVIHAASNANPDAYVSDPVGTIMTNVLGTKNVLDVCSSKDVKHFVYISSVEAYGEHGHTGAVDENVIGSIDSKRVRNCYPLSKVCAENLCMSYADQYGLSCSVARLAYIYGPGDNINDPKVITSFMKSVRDGNNIVLKSSGLQQRTYCYIKDTVCGILLALLRGDNKTIYNVSSMDNTTTIRGIAETIVDLFGHGELEVEYQIPSDADKKKFSLIQNNILDNSEIKKLGYQETVDIWQGLENTGVYFGLSLGETK